MQDELVSFKIIARIENDFQTKFGVPRQSGLVPSLTARIIFEPSYRDANAFRGLEDFSHVWLIWQFSESVREQWSPTVRPPRLGGEERMGVFATRSPFRPNAVGLSCVRLLGIEHSTTLGPVLIVSGADLMNGTPILDIKPYIRYTDSIPDAAGGFSEKNRDYRKKVSINEELMNRIPEEKREALLGVLAENPVPAYQNDPTRVYGMFFAGKNIRFRLMQDTILVTDIED